MAPLAAKLEHHAQKLNGHFCELKAQLAALNEASAIRNSWVLRSVTSDDAEESVSLENSTGWDWLIHWVSNADAENEPKIYLGSENPTRLLATLGKSESGQVTWAVPAGSNLIVTGLKGAVNFQVEMIATAALSADTGSSGEHIDVRQMPDTVPSSSVLEAA